MDRYIVFILMFLLGALIFLCVKSFIDYQKNSREQERELENNSETFEFEPDIVKAVLIDKHTNIKYTGGAKSSKCKIVYTLVFRTEFDEIKEYEVLQELFEKSMLNSSGLLLTVDGNFFDFGEGEEIAETPDSDTYI